MWKIIIKAQTLEILLEPLKITFKNYSDFQKSSLETMQLLIAVKADYSSFLNDSRENAFAPFVVMVNSYVISEFYLISSIY